MEVGTHANRIRLKTKESRFCALVYPDNAIEELYYLEMNYVASSVNYQHKNPDYDGKAILRTSFETTKKKLNKLEICSI
jgi:hypothetical protein